MQLIKKFIIVEINKLQEEIDSMKHPFSTVDWNVFHAKVNRKLAYNNVLKKINVVVAAKDL